jgi:hypothetical protein
MNGHKAAAESSFHPPPSFRLPDDFDSSRYELWTVRLPVAAEADDINGLELALSDPSSQNFESNGSKYTFQYGHPVENESFRLLLPKEKDKDDKDSDSGDDSDDSDDEKDDEKLYLYPTKIPFTRHVNVVAAVPMQAETELAPRLDNAPKPVVTVRRAYQHVPQKKGLKRRWMPEGSSVVIDTNTSVSVAAAGAVSAGAAVPSTPEKKAKSAGRSSPKKVKKEVGASPSVAPPSPASPPVAMDTTNDDHTSSPDKKARKEAKKDKKEAKEEKKAKKEAKKSKKDKK